VNATRTKIVTSAVIGAKVAPVTVERTPRMAPTEKVLPAAPGSPVAPCCVVFVPSIWAMGPISVAAPDVAHLECDRPARPRGTDPDADGDDGPGIGHLAPRGYCGRSGEVVLRRIPGKNYKVSSGDVIEVLFNV
jgi:hypothetical protein